MAPSLIVMVGEAVVVSATHGGLYLLIHCSIAQWAHSGRVFWLNKYTQYTHWTKKPEFAHCAMWRPGIKESLSTRNEVMELGLQRVLEYDLCSLFWYSYSNSDIVKFMLLKKRKTVWCGIKINVFLPCCPVLMFIVQCPSPKVCPE